MFKLVNREVFSHANFATNNSWTSLLKSINNSSNLSRIL
jgi:hypothetical protein